MRREAAMACATEIVILNAPNEGESSPNPKSLGEKKQRQNS